MTEKTPERPDTSAASDAPHANAAAPTPVPQPPSPAARSGRAEAIAMLKLLLQSSPKMELTPLMVAAIQDNAASARLLLQNGAAINEQNEKGHTALMLAAVCNHSRFVRLLLDHGADANLKAENGFTALMYAVFTDAVESVAVLSDAASAVSPVITPTVSRETMSFHDKLSFYIAQYTLHGRGKPSTIYTKANMSKQTFSKIRSNTGANYHPRKNQVFKLAIGLRLTVTQAEDLLKSAGYAFSKSDAFDQIVRQFLWDCNYNIEEIEAALLYATGKQLS